MIEPNDDLNKPDPEPNPLPQPLDYETPPPQPLLVGEFILGLGLGVIAIFAGGLVTAVSLSNPRPAGRLLFVLSFFAVTMASTFGYIAVRRGSKRRSFLLGFLIGCAIAALLDGLCFAAFAGF